MGIPTNINNLLNKNIVESERIEYKQGWNPNDIIHSICAFANDIDDFGGGYILIGVEESRGMPIFPLKGINITDINKIQGEIIEYCKKSIFPQYIPVIEDVDYSGSKIIVLWVYAGDDRAYECYDDVYRSNSKSKSCYIRKASNTIKATDSEKRELVKISSHISFDDRINRNSTIFDLKSSIIKEYLYEIKSDLYQEVDNLSHEKLLESLRIIGGPKEDLRPKNVGILFFNDSPETFIPYSYIQIDYIPDPTGVGLREKTFKGPIFRQLIDALQYIKNNFLETEIVKIRGRAESISIENYPYDVIEEILPNAILHKDYQIGEPITIRITKEKIEITSFPGIDRSINDKSIKELNLMSRRYRNKRIGEFLKELHLVEAKNTGIPKAIKALKNNNSPQLEFEMDNARSYVTVIIHIHDKFKIKDHEELKENKNDLKQRILYSVNDTPKTLSEISKELGYTSIPNSLRKALIKLIDAGIITKNAEKRYFRKN